MKPDSELDKFESTIKVRDDYDFRLRVDDRIQLTTFPGDARRGALQRVLLKRIVLVGSWQQRWTCALPASSINLLLSIHSRSDLRTAEMCSDGARLS